MVNFVHKCTKSSEYSIISYLSLVVSIRNCLVVLTRGMKTFPFQLPSIGRKKWTKRTRNGTERSRNRKNQFATWFQIAKNRNDPRKFGSYSRLTKLTEICEIHELYFTYLHCNTMFGLCVLSLLLSKIEVVLPKLLLNLHFLLLS